MSDKYIIGVDNGSQSTKVLIFNQDGKAVVNMSQPLRPLIHRRPGYAEHPGDDLWDSIKAVLKKAMAEFSCIDEPSSIIGLGLCTIRCCRVLMKKDGTLHAPVMSWMDVRAYKKYRDSPGVAYTCPTTGYITYRLTGEMKDTAANAFQWQFPVDMDTWRWTEDKTLFDKYKIPREKLLKLQMPGTILGYVTEKAAIATGVPKGTPVVATASDKAVEALGSGLIGPGTALISLGTYTASMVHALINRPATETYYTNFSCVPNEYLYESGGIRRGMSHVTWLKELLGEEYAKKAESEGYGVEDYLAKDALMLPPGSDGLLTVPDWLAPAEQQYRKGVIIGLRDIHTKAHLFRSLLEGLAMTLKNHYEAMISDLGLKPTMLIVSGGGSNSDLFMQIIADMYGVPAVRNEIGGAAALGSAICAATAVGLYATPREAVKAMVRKRDEFKPNMENYNIYAKINDGVYKDLAPLLKPMLIRARDVTS